MGGGMAKIEKDVALVQKDVGYLKEKGEERDTKLNAIHADLKGLATLATELKNIKEETIPTLRKADTSLREQIIEIRGNMNRYGMGLGAVMVIMGIIAAIGSFFGIW